MQEETQNELEKETAGILQEAIRRFQTAQDAESENRKLGADDLRVLFESSWEPGEIAERQNEHQNRPCLSFPKLNKLIHKTANQVRLNNPGPKISPEDDNSDDETAVKITGLLRQILKNSDSDTVFAQASENQLENAFGFIRVITERESDESFDQKITLDYIQNPFSVYVDASSKSVVGEDIEWFFITDDIPRREFEATWPDAIASDWKGGSVGDDSIGWLSQDTVRMAEYYRLVKDEDELIEGQNGDGKEFKGFKSDFSEKELEDSVITRNIPAVKKRWEWFKITAVDILEKADIATKRCPLIPVYGRIRIINNKKRLMSLIRYAKDAQKMYDYWQSSAAEKLSQAQKTSYIGYKGQFKSDKRWEDANINPAPYLEVDAVTIGGHPAPLPQQQPAPQPPIGYITAAQGASQDIKEIIGVDDGIVNQTTGQNSSGLQANVLSGKALDILNQNGELSTYDFISNLHKSARQAYKVVVDMIPEYYNEERVERILGEDGVEEKVVFNGKNEDGEIYDLTTGRYDVDIDVGPDYATQKEQAATETLDYAKAFPEKANAIADIVASNLSNKDSDKMARRIMKTMSPELLDTEDKKDENQLQAELSQEKQKSQGLEQQLNQAMELIQSEQLETQRVQIKEDGSKEREIIKSATTLEKQRIDSEGEIKEETIQAQSGLIESLITAMGGPEGVKQFVESRNSQPPLFDGKSE